MLHTKKVVPIVMGMSTLQIEKRKVNYERIIATLGNKKRAKPKIVQNITSLSPQSQFPQNKFFLK